MAPVMRNKSNHNSPDVTPATDDQSWEQLYGRIRVLTLKRSASMLSEPTDDADLFDRGARALRALMSAAQVARRMTQEDKKEKRLDDEKHAKPIISDVQARQAYRSAEQAVVRVEKSMGEAPSDSRGSASVPSGAGGKAMEDQRA